MAASTRVNADGLVEKYGTDQAKKTPVGEHTNDGELRIIELRLDSTNAPATASNSVVVSYNAIVPKYAFVKYVEIDGIVDFTGSGTLNVGWVDASDFSSNADVDAFVVAATVTEINDGGKNVSGWVGTAVDEVMTANRAITWEVDTAALAAGACVIRIAYFMPPKASDTLGDVLS